MSQSNPWKIATLSMVAAGLGALLSGIVVARVHRAAETPREASTPASGAPRPVETGIPMEPVEARQSTSPPAPAIAIVGAIGGSAYTLHDESQRKAETQRSYDACRARNAAL